MPPWPSLYLPASHKFLFVLPHPYFLRLMKTLREGEQQTRYHQGLGVHIALRLGVRCWQQAGRQSRKPFYDLMDDLLMV